MYGMTTPYSGVTYDFLSNAEAISLSGPAKTTREEVANVVYFCVCALDFPLSFAADTILLPITLYNAFNDTSGDSSQAAVK
jgi:uncharacterized protein YceK